MKVKVSALIEDWGSVPEILKRNAPNITKLIESRKIYLNPDEIILEPTANGDFRVVETYEFVRRTKEI